MRTLLRGVVRYLQSPTLSLTVLGPGTELQHATTMGGATYQDISSVPPRSLADLIATRFQPDVLVVAGLSSGTIEVLSERPSPIQLAYCSTRADEAVCTSGYVDYILTDAVCLGMLGTYDHRPDRAPGQGALSSINPVIFADEAEPGRPSHSRRYWVLPRCHLAFTPPQFHGTIRAVAPSLAVRPMIPDIAPKSARASPSLPRADASDTYSLPQPPSSEVAFGVFAHLTRLTDEALGLYAGVLKHPECPPNAVLKIRAPSLSSARVRADVEARAAAVGLTRAQLDLAPSPIDPYEKLQEISRCAVILDPPTSAPEVLCAGLCMGVPCSTLSRPYRSPGEGRSRRVGTCVVSAVGHPDWAARGFYKHQSEAPSHQLTAESWVSPEMHYAQIAVQLAARYGPTTDPADMDRSQARRRTLRQELLNSPLCDVSSLAADLRRSLWAIATSARF
jgi:hypothetical protein